MNDDHASPALRLPAGELEMSVRTAIADWIENPGHLADIVIGLQADKKCRLFGVCTEIAHTVRSAPINEARKLLARLAVHLSISFDEARVSFNAGALSSAAGLNGQENPIELVIPTDRKTYGHEARLRLEPSAGSAPAPDRALVELLGRSVAARDELVSLTDAEVSAMPVTRLRHLQRTARLSYLDPSIVRSILEGTQPKTLQARELWRMAELPLEWAQQRTMLGVASS